MKITHIYHSGFAVELKDSNLIFDWYTGKLPELPADKPLYVFVSHSHPDHYGTCIWELRERFHEVYYIMDRDTAPGAEGVYRVQPDRSYEIGAVRITTLLSTDQGVAFFVEAEGRQIYHSGDLNVWYWNGEPAEDNRQQLLTFRKEISRLSGRKIDAAFLPLDPRLEEHAPMAIEEFMKLADCRDLFPMHYWDRLPEVREYLKDPRLLPYRDRIHLEDQVELQ